MELVLACGPKGVAIHPGDYRVTVDAMKGADPLLASQLRALVRQQEIAHPGTTVVPTLRYVIAPGGRESYGSARGQAAVEGIDWPSTIQVSGGDILRLYSSDAW